jgi:hypothetical protein
LKTEGLVETVARNVSGKSVPGITLSALEIGLGVGV